MLKVRLQFFMLIGKVESRINSIKLNEKCSSVDTAIFKLLTHLEKDVDSFNLFSNLTKMVLTVLWNISYMCFVNAFQMTKLDFCYKNFLHITI